MRLFALFAVLFAVPAWSLEALDDADLAGVTGQEGVSVRLELRVNADATGAPLSGGAGDINCLSGLDGPCTFAVQFANRTNKWLVFKQYSYVLKVDNQYLDASTLNETGSNPAYFNAAESLPGTAGNSRFEDRSGVCLLTSCDVATIQNLQAMRMSVPTTVSSYNRSTRVSSGYDSIQLGGTIGGLSAETIAGGAIPTNGVDNSSFLGLNIRDNNGNLGGVRLTGNVYLFGF